MNKMACQSDVDGLANPYWRGLKGKRFLFKATVSNRGEEVDVKTGRADKTISFKDLFYSSPDGKAEWVPFRGHLWIRDGNKWSEYIEDDTLIFEAKLTTYQKVDESSPTGLIEKISFKGVDTSTIKRVFS